MRIEVNFTPSDLEELTPCNTHKGSVRRSLLKRVVGRKVLKLVLEHYHPNARLDDALLRRQVSLRKGDRELRSFGLLEIHYKLHVSDRNVYVRFFSVVSKSGGIDASLYLKNSSTYRE